ncbi:serine-protein kinase ATM isoform X2 [Euwallacea similis]|uniref:serine-protein kinase ATM isoform X2 n=1 Tax=Euwallacea similis TaxID=1736056 RepID=UPI00345052CA
MSFQRELEEAQANLRSTKQSERKKSLEKLINLIDTEAVISQLTRSHSWSIFLESAQMCLKKECDRVEGATMKKGPLKGPDKLIDMSLELVSKLIKFGIQEDDIINLSTLVRYIEGCLQERGMRVCRDAFLKIIKDQILQNPISIGCLEPDDFICLFNILKNEFLRGSSTDGNNVIVFKCFSLIVKNGPLASFPASFLREQFGFVSKLCQSITQHNARVLQEDAVEIVLNFCKHTAEDNRVSCMKLGEDVFQNLVNLYCSCGHDSQLKLNVIEFGVLQMTLHSRLAGQYQVMALNSHCWELTVRQIYTIVTTEISQYLRQNVKNVHFFIPQGKMTVILDSFVVLFVEVCKELFSTNEPNAANGSQSILCDLDLCTQVKKKRKVDASLKCFIEEIKETKSWVWIKLVGSLLAKYPQLINDKLYLSLVKVLHSLQLEVRDSLTTSYIYETQSVLLDIEPHLDFKDEMKETENLWRLVGDSTLRAVGLNQNVKETQNLLQKLINSNLIDLESVIQTYVSGVLIITEHHVHTLQLVLEHINFSQLEFSKREELFNSLLNGQSIKDFHCLLKPSFAKLLVALTLKQCPPFKYENAVEQSYQYYKILADLYAKSNFELAQCRSLNPIKESLSDRSFNVDYEVVKILTEKLQSFALWANAESTDKLLCIVGLLYNVLSYMFDFQAVGMEQIQENPIFGLINQLLDRDSIKSFSKYENHNEKMLKELVTVVEILDYIFSLNNSVTSIVKNLFHISFLRGLLGIVNFFQHVSKSKVELEHRVKKSVIGALAKYSLVSNVDEASQTQEHIMVAIAKPDYNFGDDTDYDLIMVFLSNIHLAKENYLSETVICNVLQCIRGLAFATYRRYESALHILQIQKGVYQHLKHIENDALKNEAVDLLKPFYLRSVYYGPKVALAVLDCIEELCKADPQCSYSQWDNKEIIKYVPTYLSSNFQRVRYRAIEVLELFLSKSSGSTRLETIHLSEELFDLIYESNIIVFEIEGDLTDERKKDEVIFRASSALQTFLSIIVNCNSWIEESLFAIIRLEHNKKLYDLCNGELMRRAFLVLKNHFGSENFMEKYVESILTNWFNLGYKIGDFEYRMLGCTDKIHLYTKYFDICLPLLLKTDRTDLFIAARQLGMTEKDIFERCCTKIFGRALSNGVSNLNANFIQSNVEVAYTAQVLGSRLKENLIENIDQLILCLINMVTDARSLELVLGENVLFISKGILLKDFQACISFVESFLCDSRPLIEFLSRSNISQLQQINLHLQCKVYSATVDQQLKCFHQYTIFTDLIISSLKELFPLTTFFLRDTIYFLMHLAINISEIKVCRAVLRYIHYFLKNILPDKTKDFEEFLLFTVNSLKNICQQRDALSALCIDTLEFLIIDNQQSLMHSIEKLDAFPLTSKFDRIRNAHQKIKYEGKNVTLVDEIKSFLAYSDFATRQDSLIHLKHLLSKEKEQVKQLYDNLSEIRGFSEDCEESLIHRLTSMLIKMSCYPRENISQEAIKCLGELGPADLTTIVLEPEKKVLDIKCTPLELFTGHVVSLLTQYIVDPVINVAKTATEVLYEVMKYKEGKKVVDSGIDFGYRPINEKFIIPYMSTSQKVTSQLKVDIQVLSDMAVTSRIWCPSSPIENDEWITSLVLGLLNAFNYGAYLRDLASLCKVKAKFCEHILPILVYLMLSLNNSSVTKVLSNQINSFFTQHWSLTLSSSSTSNLIPVNKKSVKCMLDVVNFIRQQPVRCKKSHDLELNYLPIGKAAAFCSAHFSALLYTELWCQEKIASAQEKLNGQPFENGYTLVDFIYESQSQEEGVTLQQILQSSYKSIGDLDALSGCGISLFLQPERRVEYYKNTGQWDLVMNYYSINSVRSSEMNGANLIESFKMNGLYQLPLLCDNISKQPQYECLWRLGQWNLNKKDAVKYNEINSSGYDKYQFYCLKALCDNDKYTFNVSKNQLDLCIIDNLKHTSLESTKSLYPIFSQLQSLTEMDDCLNATDDKCLDETIRKWKAQDTIIRKNEFQFIEPIIAQRMTILGEYVKKDPALKKKYFNLMLDIADYAREEFQIRVAENAILNIRKIPNLDNTIETELQLREAQLEWLKGDKFIAQQLLRKLYKANNITPRLKASCLRLQAVYMTEMYYDKTLVLNNFNELLQKYKEIRNNMTAEDYKNLLDAYDKIATFTDREYQQIMSHINSDLFQKKISTIKSCKEVAMAFNEQKKKTDDEKKAQIIHERQIHIDESEVTATQRDKDQLLGFAIKYYIKNLLSCDVNNIKIFRIMTLFLENKDNKTLNDLLQKMVPQFPSYKYIIMLPQLIPHITNHQHDLFGQQINQIIEKCASDHPHHTLPLLLALVNANKDREYTSSKTKVAANERTITAGIMLSKLRKKSGFNSIIDKMLKLADALIELAYYVDNGSQSGRKNEFEIPSRLKIRKIKAFDDILVPTVSLPVSKNNTYDKIVGISRFIPKFGTVGGINAPKRIECRCTFGETHLQLVKGQDDLRQDAVMQQVFTIITNLLSSNKQTNNLLVRTYKIVPLSMRSGVLEWVANSMPIGEYLCGSREYVGAHKEFRSKDKTPTDCKQMFRMCQGKSLEDKLAIYNSICKQFHPIFHKFFETYFRQPSVWYERRRAYIHSVATTSMCGYVLGIGDRHVSNILVDKQTAEVIHIDFGIAFEQGKCLPTPETVPFRLSRDIVDGMGVSGVEGLFRKSCEKTMEVLRSNSQTILTILEVLLYDPLYFWTVSAAEAKKRQTEDDSYGPVADDVDEENKNISAQRALLRLRGKLQGTEEGKPSSVEQQVGTLIQQAMEPMNLCRLFHGWQPYL